MKRASQVLDDTGALADAARGVHAAAVDARAAHRDERRAARFADDARGVAHVGVVGGGLAGLLGLLHTAMGALIAECDW